eukprot:gnl/MRDRNA2_/MRDRNA2_84736_c0_seq2.p2 gnl/MRDRNA2_/MRDRNA2_84736_c0~~gnl/MRDRNA2_/MRDRNA2_84736_c0_seq2.p2  ORF type:complete len:124 (+),score=35.30 gnl/MRDRNA2_/MRDRNA2_84736_c0_seq2:380-751(+)
MMACKMHPLVLWKAGFFAGDLDIPVLKGLMDSWGSYLRITVCKYKPHKKSLEILEKRQDLAKEVITSLCFNKAWSPTKILQSPCFHKNTDAVESLEEDLMTSLYLTAKGSQWLTQQKWEKMAC